MLRELAAIAFANVLDYAQPDLKGNVTVDFTHLDPDVAAAVQEIAIDSTETVRGDSSKTVQRVRVKLANKLAALAHLGKHLGLFATRRTQIPVHGETSDADLQARARDIIRALRELGIDPHSSDGIDGDFERTHPPS